MNRAGALALVLSLGAAVALHLAEDRWFPAPGGDEPSMLYVRSGATMKRLTLEYNAITADVYWIRALQHFGRERLSTPPHVRTYALLYPLLDLTTTLDPYFSIAYRFGAIFLGEPFPGGPDRPDLAVALLQKALAHQPRKWQYMEDLGFVYYWHVQDHRTAAAWFERAAAVPGAPNWLLPLAAVTLAEGGHRGAARSLWERIAQSEQGWLRDAAALRLAQLDAMDVIDALQARVTAFEGAHPGEAPTWDRLRAAGLLRGVPLDSTGVPFVIDATGHVTVSGGSKLFPLPGRRAGDRP